MRVTKHAIASKESMPIRRSSARINQLQDFFTSAYSTSAQTLVKADKRSLVMHCQRKKVGIRDLPVVKKCFRLKEASSIPGQLIMPKT